MSFKLVKSDKKALQVVDNTTFITFLLENHKKILVERSREIESIVGGIYIPEPVLENKKEFDFFFDEKRDAAKKEAIKDLDDGIISKTQEKKDAVVVDRRKVKGKAN